MCLEKQPFSPHSSLPRCRNSKVDEDITKSEADHGPHNPIRVPAGAAVVVAFSKQRHQDGNKNKSPRMLIKLGIYWLGKALAIDLTSLGARTGDLVHLSVAFAR